MKRALRNTDTSMFIKSDLGETELIDQAHVFANYQAAFEFCKDKQLKRVELVVRVSDKYEFIVEVPAPELNAELTTVEKAAAAEPESEDAPEPEYVETPVRTFDLG
jgi:hypothetical protein